MYLERKFHPIGQGLFCTERFSTNEGQPPFFNIIYDCGTLNSQNLVDNAIAAEFGPLTDRKVDIDFVFISHFHADHISGLDTLQKYCNIKEYIIPALSTERIVEAYIYNIIHGNSSVNRVLVRFANQNVEGVRQIGEQDDISHLSHEIPYWLIKPYMPADSKQEKLKEELNKKGFSGLWNAFDSRDFAAVDSMMGQMGREGRKKLKTAYDNAYGGDHKYMLTLYSGYNEPKVELEECNALYCGDYEAADNNAVIALTDPLNNRWPMIGTLQVPHHGSKYNNCQKLYEAERHCVISYGDSHYKHPHIETIKYILNAQNGKALKTLHLVNANTGFSQQLTI